MANTSPDNIYYPLSTDAVAPLESVFAAQAQSTQLALDKRAGYDYRWASATARNAQTGMRTGDEGYTTSTADVWKYIGGTWRLWASGTKSFTPAVVNINLGSGASTFGQYTIASGLVTARFYIVLGTGGTVGTGPQLVPPVSTNNGLPSIGHGTIGIAGNNYGLIGSLTTANITLETFRASGNDVFQRGVTGSVPATFASGSSIRFNISYLTDL